MGKRIAAALLFLIAAAAICILSVRYINSAGDKLISLTDNMLELKPENDEFIKEKNELLKIWSKNKVRFGMLLSHNDFDIIQKDMMFIREVKLPQEADKLIERLHELKEAVTVARDGERLLWENIF